MEKQAVKKRERKALEKSFKLAQLSTASMGKFDKKVSVSKNFKEQDAPNSQKVQKKKSNAQMAELQKNPKAEKDRSLKILNWMSRAEEVQHKSKADAHVKGADMDKQ